MEIKSKELFKCLIENIEKINWRIDFPKVTADINSTKIIISVSPENEYYMELRTSDGEYYEIKDSKKIRKLYKKIEDYQEIINLNKSIDEIIDKLK